MEQRGSTTPRTHGTTTSGKAIGTDHLHAKRSRAPSSARPRPLRGNGPAGDDGEPADTDACPSSSCGRPRQFLEMIPLGGDIAASTLEAFLRGTGARRPSLDNSPMLNEASKALVSVPAHAVGKSWPLFLYLKLSAAGWKVIFRLGSGLQLFSLLDFCSFLKPEEVMKSRSGKVASGISPV